MPLNAPRYAENSLSVNAASIAVVPGSMNIGEEHLMEKPESGNNLTPDLDVTLSIRNLAEFGIYDPLFEDPEVLTGLVLNWKLYGQNAEAVTSGKSRSFAKAFLIPQGFSAEKGQLATFSHKALALFTSGNSITESTALGTRQKVDDPYHLDSVSIGGTPIKSVRSVSANYNTSYEWPPELEPEEAWITKKASSLTITLDDHDEATIARFKTGDVDDIVVTFKDESGATSTRTFNNCSIRSGVSGGQVTLNAEQLTT
ncbi:MAG: hypothetical protein ACPG5T_00475 [Endozoicomonas sp.]